MNPQVVKALNVLTATLAFFVAFGPQFADILKPYPKACIAVGVVIALLTKFSKLIEVLRGVLNSKETKHITTLEVSTLVEKSTTEKAAPPVAGPPTAALVLLAAGTLLFASPVFAQASPVEPQYGGCFNNGTICLGPSVTITVGEFNFSTSKFAGGIIPGVGYGATFMANTWHTVGLDLYLSAILSQSVPNNVVPSLMLSFANYVRIGLGYSFTEQSSGPVLKQMLLLGGIGTNFGGSSGYVKAQVEAQVAATAKATP